MPKIGLLILAGLFFCLPRFSEAASAVPLALNLPALRQVLPIVPVGVTKTGNLDTPHNYKEVGWYSPGPVPGTPGNAVLDGHVDNSAAVPGPFKHLKESRAGDWISITLSDGSQKTFVITQINVYKTSQFPSQKIFYDQVAFDPGGRLASQLQIITCHGRWVPALKTYDQRLVVTAQLLFG